MNGAVAASGFSPGAEGIPKIASTTFFGGGIIEQVMNFTALIAVFAAVCSRMASETAAICALSDVSYFLRKGVNECGRTSSGVSGSSGCAVCTDLAWGVFCAKVAVAGTCCVAVATGAMLLRTVGGDGGRYLPSERIDIRMAAARGKGS